MFRIAFLRNMLIISLLLVTMLPLYQLVFIHPSYRDLLTRETEVEAARLVSFLVRSLGLDDKRLGSELMTPDVLRQIELAVQDPKLIKLRVFSPTGKIVYSTLPEEIGRVNQRPYFLQEVARGHIFSKVVRKDHYTADGQHIDQDVVETYVPVMTPHGFGGAMEVYYDITESQQRLGRLTRHSVMILFGLGSSLLLIILILLVRARRFWFDRQKAEEELKQSHQILELRVQERTGQLLMANQKLAEEVAEKTRAQTALRQALAETEAEREKIDGILSSVADGLLVVDDERRLVHMNRPAEEIFSLSAASSLGLKLEEVLPDTRLLSPLLDCLQKKSGIGHFDFPRPAPQGQLHGKIYQARCSPLRNRQGETIGHIILVQDVSREREVERMKSEFLAMAAHELHTPITTIMGYSELLASRPLEEFSPEQSREFIGYIHQKAEALARMVDDLLDISRREAGHPLVLHLDRFDVCELLDRIAEIFPRDEGHRLHLEVASRPLIWPVDRVRFEQLVGNLLSNAVKYSPNGGDIHVRARIEGDCLRLEVEDQGIGMTPEEQNHVFERFYRADSSTTAVAGVGLGMSVAQMIVDAHGGEIRIESEKGKGTLVIVLLPQRPPGEEDD
ncbi:signal transduction histidine kinase [Geothermobacter ehrlichii]|uniref:histidine kinase n=1 Tax=Geothermobacter ehrlichii TaxID=213224 RepID=A0A5D3WKN9_9BACT|nr:ATP-binding protein [Geothermobacter ehrlichii]TYO98962.1 signal transduction histidine kinase [Geothermobacter ehrlichii]